MGGGRPAPTLILQKCVPESGGSNHSHSLENGPETGKVKGL